jgi:hypothetical protein
LALVLGLGALIVALGGIDDALLNLMPLAMLVVAMVVWPYPGTELIERLVRRWSRRASGAPLAPRARAPRRTPHGGRLLAHALGGRAPPALAGCV